MNIVHEMIVWPSLSSRRLLFRSMEQVVAFQEVRESLQPEY